MHICSPETCKKLTGLLIVSHSIYGKFMVCAYAFGVASFMACDSAVEETPIEDTPARAISWCVQSGDLVPTKALVDDEALCLSCTPNAYGNYESIGLWGEYTTTENGVPCTATEFDAVPLIYAKKPTHTNPYNDWNYPDESRYWKSYAQYDFRACYPQALMKSLMTEMSPTIIQGGPVNTARIQKDLLVAATHVDIQDVVPAGPVPLNMQHIFAALKFKIRAAEGYTPTQNEGITSCWLQNQSNATDLFSPSGYLVHSGNKEPKIDWHTYEATTAKMYLWKHNGLSFNSEQTLYTANGGDEGEVYTHNNGWLLVIPQMVKEGTLNFCYTMKNAGEQVFSVNVPAITYEAGTQYIYVLLIKGSGVDLNLTIKEWNSLDSSHDIIL